MRINQNIAALNAWRNLTSVDGKLNKSLERLSSGLRINRAADDAAGLAISEKMRAQISGLKTSQRNAQDAISLLQTAEGALNEVHGILQRLRELGVQASSDSMTDTDRQQIQKEVDALVQELDRISTTTEFNTKKLLDGSAGVSVTESSSSLSNAAATNDTVAGTYTITAATVAATYSDSTTATFASTSTTLSAASAVTVNGRTYSFTTSSTVQNVLDAINADTSISHVKASYNTGDSKIYLSTDTAGSAYALTFQAAGTGNLAGLDTNGSGTDATATFSAGVTSYEAVGNKVTVVQGNAKGLSFTLDANIGANTGLTVGTNGSMVFQIGANSGQTMNLSIGDTRASALGVSTVNVTTKSNASSALTAIDTALNSVSTERAKLGAVQNRLEYTIANLASAAENLTAAESRIRDVDMALEMSAFTRNQILLQSGTAMIAQANAKPQSILQLLK